MRSYEEAQEIVEKVQNHQISLFSLEVLKRNDLNTAIRVLGFDDNRQSFYDYDRLEADENKATRHLSKGEAINLVMHLPKYYVLKSNEVIYNSDVGHFDGLTRGKTYTVIAENEQQYVVMNDLGAMSTIHKDKFVVAKY